LLNFALVERNTRCCYKITGFNFFPVPCKLGNSELCVVLACVLPERRKLDIFTDNNNKTKYKVRRKMTKKQEM
jgi:hypothetical protein